jgi:DNA-binding YbaB/EbfC family protein
MRNLGDMMKQAQQMQAKMGEAQEKIEAMQVTGASGGGMVEVTLSGKGDMCQIQIDPSLLSGNDKEVLEDLIVAAHNDARSKAEALVQEEMAKVTGGLNLPPGLKLPF